MTSAIKLNKLAKKLSMNKTSTKQSLATVRSEEKALKLGKDSLLQSDSEDSPHACTSIGLDSSGLPVLLEAAMPGWIGDLVSAVCKTSEAHPAAVLANVLSRFSVQISKSFISYRGDNHHCCINFVVVGNSSKSWNSGQVPAIGRIFDGMPNRPQIVNGHLTSGQSLIDALRNQTGAFGNAKRRDVLTDLDISENRLLFLEKDFHSVISNAKRPGNTLSPTISGLFNNGGFEQPLKSGSITASGAHVVILANTHCTDFLTLRNDVQRSNGFASHFLWILVDRLKLVPRPKDLQDDEVSSFRETILSCIYKSKELAQVKLSKKTRTMWDALYPDLSQDVPGVAGSVVSRSEIHTLRLALIYAIAAGHKMIKIGDLHAAHALVMYARESALTIFNGDQQANNFKGKILCALHTAPNQEMSRTEINNKVFNRNIDSDVIKGALREMEEMNQVEVIKKKSTSGAPKTIFKLVAK